MAEITWQAMVERAKKTNEAFSKANKAQKRVMIAKDVIKSIDLKLMTEEPPHTGLAGGYLSPQQIHAAQASRGSDFRSMMPNFDPCRVCAKGALFLCTVARRDRVTAGEYLDIDWRHDPSLSKAMGGIFPEKMLDRIEDIFEGYDNDFEGYDGTRARTTTPVGSMARMKWIMKNIIDHKGEFCP